MPPLPEGTLLLHIGPPKTGSTAIQVAMHQSRQTLAEHGVLYPGTTRRAREASFAVLGTPAAIGRGKPRMESWNALVEEMAATDLPRVCLSHENFARADDAAIDRILAGTGRDRTHVVYVARRFDRLLPSHWQERVKARQTFSYEEYLHTQLDEPANNGSLWRPHDVAAVIDRWADHVGRDRITIVVYDEDDHGVIPRAFEGLLDLPEGILTPPTSPANASLSYTEVEAIRQLNRMARDRGWTDREYWRIVQDGVVAALRERDRGDDLRLAGLPAWAFARVADRSDAQIAAIRDAVVDVIGDPELLRVRDRAEPAPLPPDVEAVPLDLFTEIVRGAVDGARSMHERELTRAVRAARRTAGSADQIGGRHLLRLIANRAARRLRLSRG